jgi:hypothetical protein
MADQIPILDTWIYRALAWLGVALQAAALIAVVVVERWKGLPSIALFLGLSFVFLLLQDRLPSLISMLVVIAALVNAAGWAWNLFPVPLYDDLVHGFTAFAGMAAIGYLCWTRGLLDAAPGSAKFVLAVAAAGLALGVLWELAEARFLNLTWTDTLLDLLVDTIGAALGGVLAGWAIRRQGRLQRTARRVRA